MEQTDLLRKTVEILDSLGVPYAVVGSFASGAWGEPRLTQDIDIVVDLNPAQVGPLCEAFPDPEFYVSRPAALEAVAKRDQFNIIHPASGNNIDFMIAGRTAWALAQLRRRVCVAVFPDINVSLAAPDDVILGKLVYYHEGRSEKHLRDIAGILRISGEAVDREYVARFAVELGVADVWKSVLCRVDPSR